MLVKSLFLNLYSLVWQIYVLDYFWHEEYTHLALYVMYEGKALDLFGSHDLIDEALG
jgi:hypothetical protein